LALSKTPLNSITAKAPKSRIDSKEKGICGKRDVVHKLHLDLPDRVMNSPSGIVPIEKSGLTQAQLPGDESPLYTGTPICMAAHFAVIMMLETKS
jgi:hypothetical protein